jgi:hypothetical protein
MSNRQTPYSDFDDVMFNVIGVLFSILSLTIAVLMVIGIYALNT